MMSFSKSALCLLLASPLLAAIVAVGCSDDTTGGTTQPSGSGASTGTSTGGAGGAAGAAGAGGAAGAAGAAGAGGGTGGTGAWSGQDGGFIPVSCVNQIYLCGNGIDDDGDGLTDWQDPECLGPCDNSEKGLSVDIPGGSGPACTVDCFWDSNSGSGNDECYWNHACDPLSTAPDYNPEWWNGAACEFNQKREHARHEPELRRAAQQPAGHLRADVPGPHAERLRLLRLLRHLQKRRAPRPGLARHRGRPRQQRLRPREHRRPQEVRAVHAGQRRLLQRVRPLRALPRQRHAPAGLLPAPARRRRARGQRRERRRRPARRPSNARPASRPAAWPTNPPAPAASTASRAAASSSRSSRAAPASARLRLRLRLRLRFRSRADRLRSHPSRNPV